jgi:predicted thioesterase
VPVWVKRLLPHLEQARARLVAWMAAVQLSVIASEWMIQIHEWVSVQVQTLQSSVQENRTNSGHYLQLETESGICRPACCVV